MQNGDLEAKMTMPDTGKFVWNNASAYLTYRADLESGVFNIENLDKVGYEFLQSLDVGQEISLQKSNIENIPMVVISLERGISDIRCQARAL